MIDKGTPQVRYPNDDHIHTFILKSLQNSFCLQLKYLFYYFANKQVATGFQPDFGEFPLNK